MTDTPITESDADRDTSIDSELNADEDRRSSAMTRSPLAAADLETLRLARLQLDRSRGVVVRAAGLLAAMLGPAASLGLRQLKVSPNLVARAQGVAEAALRRAFDMAVVGVGSGTGGGLLRVTDRWGQIVAASSGAVTGLLGVAGFLPDVTLNTLLIMRRIAAIAAEEGEDLSSEETRAACLQVFALDPAKPAVATADVDMGDAEFRYWTTRFFLQGRPLVFLLSEVAGTYGLRISQKLALQAVPLVGAAGAAVVNTVFLDHYQSLARVHFTIRRLERLYGTAAVSQAWKDLQSTVA